MKKFRLYAAAGLCALMGFVASCTDDKDDSGPKQPTVTFESSYKKTATSLVVTVQAISADRAAWMILERNAAAPAASDILGGGKSFAVGSPVSLTIEELMPHTAYTVYAVAAKGDVTGEVARLECSTRGDVDMVTITDAGKNFVTYHVKAEAEQQYGHLLIVKDTFDEMVEMQQDEMRAVQTLLSIYGTVGKGAQDFVIRDCAENFKQGQPAFDVVAGLTYVILLNPLDAANQFLGDYQIEERTLPDPEINGKQVRATVAKTTMDGATISVSPDPEIVSFYAKILSKQEGETFLADNGEDALRKEIVSNVFNRTTDFTKPAEWIQLNAGTDYIHYAIGIDGDGNQTAIEQVAFKTENTPVVDTENIAFDRVVSTLHAENNGVHNYYFILSDKLMQPDEYGDPYPVTFPCHAINCDLYGGAWETDSSGAKYIPEGVYEYGEDFSAGTWGPSDTWAIYFESEDYDQDFEFTGGTIRVQTDGDYLITIDLTTSTGQSYTGSYEGPIAFPEEEPAPNRLGAHRWSRVLK